jgi:glycosyltransferase involved in cell wall biosynthesis
MPRVTVVMATYNWSTVLPYSIGSALRQSFTDFELLVVGDGCTDDSAEVVAAIDDRRVRWINLPANSGHQSAPNNEGLRQARGEIIAYLGHDDLWLPHHLEVLVGALDRESSDGAFGIEAQVAAEGRAIWPTMPRSGNDFSHPSGVVHRRSLTETVGGWRDYRELSITPEGDLYLRARAAGFRFTLVRRLTVIKFHASARRDVYRIRPCHEQAAWFERIVSEPDLEQQLLVRFIVEDRVPTGLAYRDVVRYFWDETKSRIRRRLYPVSGGQKTIDEAKRFKGVPGGERR